MSIGLWALIILIPESWPRHWYSRQNCSKAQEHRLYLWKERERQSVDKRSVHLSETLYAFWAAKNVNTVADGDFGGWSWDKSNSPDISYFLSLSNEILTFRRLYPSIFVRIFRRIVLERSLSTDFGHRPAVACSSLGLSWPVPTSLEGFGKIPGWKGPSFLREDLPGASESTGASTSDAQ